MTKLYGEYEKKILTALNGLENKQNKDKYPEMTEDLNDWFEHVNKYKIDDNWLATYTLRVCENLSIDDKDKKIPSCISELIIELYEDAGNNGGFRSLYRLGLLYQSGRFGLKDIEKAIYYYKKASDLGDFQATAKLGDLYYFGKDLEKDYSEARKYYKLGMEQGSVHCMYMLGDMYKNGQYYKKNLKKAYEYYNKAYYMPVADAEMVEEVGDVIMRMGDIYSEAINKKPDFDLADQYFRAAVEIYAKATRGVDNMQLENLISKMDNIIEHLKKIYDNLED